MKYTHSGFTGLAIAAVLTGLSGCGGDAPPPIPTPVKPTNSVAAVAAAPVAGSTKSASAVGQVRLEAQVGGKIRYEGTSTIHDWYAEGSIISGSVEMDPAFPLDPAAKPPVGKINMKATVTIPVRTLKSSSKKPMDIIMYDYMKIDQFPKIEYKLTEMTLKEIPARGGLMCEAVGDLTVAGVTKKITMPIGLERLTKDTCKFYTMAPVKLKMTDYGITPPNPNIAGVGIKTGDEISLTFEWPVGVGGTQ